MNRYLYIFLFICVFTLASFLLFESLGLTFESLLKNTTSKWLIALLSVALLAVDVLLPIPSSFVMVSNGVFFGVLGGTLLSLLGGLLSAATGYFIGAKSGRVARRFTGDADEQRAKGFLEKYGYLAVVVSRPIPVLAESVAIISGTLRLSPQKVMFNAFVGLLPICLVYAITGAYSTSFDSALYAFLLNFAIAGLIWFISRPKK